MSDAQDLSDAYRRLDDSMQRLAIMLVELNKIYSEQQHELELLDERLRTIEARNGL